MDLSLFFAGTGGSVPTARRGLPALAPAPRRRPHPVRLRRGHPAPAPALRRPRRTSTRVFLTHFHADHWLGLPGMLKTFDLRGRERAADDLRPARACAPVRGAAPGLRPRRATRSSWSSSSRDDDVAPRRLRDRPVPGRAPRPRPTATRSSRTTAPGRFDAGRGRAPGRAAGPGLRPPAARRDRRRRAPRAGHRAGPRRAASRRLRRHRAVPRRVGSPPTAPTCSSTRRPSCERGAPTRARDRPLDRAPGRRARARRRGPLLALTHLSTRYFGREVRDEARAVVPSTTCRATSTRSRSRSPSAGSRELVSREEPVAGDAAAGGVARAATVAASVL